MAAYSKTRRRTVMLLAALPFAVLSASLSSAQEARIRVLRSPVGEFQPLYIAEEQGYFKEKGLKVEVSVGGAPAQNVAQLLSGQTDLTMTGAIDVVTAVSQGLPLVAVLNIQDHDEVHTTGLLTPPGSSLTTVLDFKGKKLGVPFAQRSIQGLMVYRAFERAGLSPADANLVNLPFDTVIESAENGNVDAITPVGLFYAVALAKGFKEVPAFYDEIKGTPAALFATTKPWAAANAKTLAAFTEAMEKAYAYANAHPEAVRAIDGTQTRQPKEYLANRHIAPFTSVLQREIWMKMVADMKKYGIISTTPSEADFIWADAPK